MTSKAPVVQKLSGNIFGDDLPFVSNLLDDAFDPGRLPLSITNLAPTVTTASGRVLMNGVDYTLSGARLTVTTTGLAKFAGLGEGNLDTLTVLFNVTDGLSTVTNSLSLKIFGWNEPPTTHDVTIQALQSRPYAFKTTDFPFADVDPHDKLTKIEIEKLPAKGLLTLNGVAVRAGQTISAADVAAGKLVYTPPAGATGAGFASLVFEVLDSHGADSRVARLTIDLVKAGPTGPVLTPVANQTLEATNPAGAAAAFAATATDATDGTDPVVFREGNAIVHSGDTLSIGAHSITASATDSLGNTSSEQFTITVRDTTPPALTPVANQTDEATGTAGAVAIFAATATDLVDGTDPVVFKEGLNVVHSGDTFSIGAHTITASATDAHGNTSSEQFSITVRDTTPPVLTTVPDQTDEATSAAGAVATFAATATDLVDGTDPVVFKEGANVVHSGDTFSVGTHTITASAADTHGNAASESFTLTVTSQTNPPPPPPVFDLARTDQVGPQGTHETQSANVTLVGTTGANDTVTILSTGQTTLSDNLGNFQFSNVALGQGDNTLTVQTTDAHGQTSSFTLDVRRLTAGGSTDAAITWNKIALKAIANDASIPEFAARALAMESLAVFDTVSAIDGTAGYLLKPTAAPDASPDAAVAQAAHDVLAYLYPGQAASFDALLAQSLAAVPDGQAKVDGIALGKTVAAEIVALRANDGWNAVVIDNGSDAVGAWRPTGPAFAPAQGPQWANVTPFALTSPGQFLPPPPPDLTSAAYAAAVNEVQSLGSATSTTRTADQTQIAKFWADGSGTYTPPGQWNSIADQIAQQQGNSLSADARLLAELNVAEADSGIAAWNAKYAYNLWRPVTAIQNANSIGNVAITQDPNWQSLIIAPNFPSYVSGHSTFSAAAADILTSIFGANFAFSYTDPAQGSLAGVTRSYTSFTQAAQEAGISRIYGGIHYSFDNTAGLALGQQIGDWTLKVFNQSTDTTPPVVSLDQSSGLAINQALIITGHVTDNLSGVASLQALIDGGAFQNVAFDPATGSFALPTNLPLDGTADGAHVVDFTAVDAAGNSSGLSSLVVTLDTKAPSITLLATSAQAGGTLFSGERLAGIADPTGSKLVSLNYSFDNGAAIPIAFDSTTEAFDSPLGYGGLSIGTHALRISATDSAGNIGTDNIQVIVAAPPALTIASLTPAVMAMDVGVTYRPEITFSRAIDPSTLTSATFYATDTTGALIPATIVPLADGTGAWMLFNGPMPGASAITLHVVGNAIKAADGALLDAADTGVPGSIFTETYTTVSTAAVPGTTISGILADPGPDLTPMTPDDIKAGPNGLADFVHDTFKLPIAGVKVFVLGHEDQAVFTDAQGRYTLTNVPSGDVKVEFDGTAATNAPAGFYFPVMVMDVNVQPGVANTIMGGMGSLATQAANATNPVVYLPRLETGILQTLSTTQPTTITAPLDSAGASGLNLTPQQIAELSITVQPGSLVDANGHPVANAKIGISPVPASLVMDMLPPGILQHSFDITIQAPGGAVFTQPATLTMPNVFGLAAGDKTYMLSFDHTTGRLVVDGTATVSADGLTVTSDPGSGVMQPGWHAMTPRLARLLAEAAKNGCPADPSLLSGINDTNGWITNTGEAVKRYGSDAFKASNVGLASRVATFVPIFGTGAAYLAAESDRADYNSHLANFNKTGSLEEAGGVAVAGVKYGLDRTAAFLGTVELLSGPLAPVLEATKDAVNLVTLGIFACEKIYDGVKSIANSITGYDPSAPTGPFTDPDLQLQVSSDGGPQEIAIYVDGVLQGDQVVTADHASGQTQSITISGILGTQLHKITVQLVNPVAGTTLETQKNVHISGVAFNGQQFDYNARLYGTATDPSATFHVGSEVPPELTKSESTSQLAIAESDYVRKLLPAVQTGLTDLANIIPSADFSKPDLGLSASTYATLLPDLTPYMEALHQLAGHASPTDLAQQAMQAAVAYDNLVEAPLFTPIDAPSTSPAVAPVAAGSTFYAALDDLAGTVQRFTFDPLTGIDYFLQPDTFYKLTLFDPTGFRVGETFFTSAASGQSTTIPSVGVAPDRGPALANGLTATESYVLGVDPTRSDNLVPGMSDLEALRTGLAGAALSANTTGVIASVPLLGTAKAVVVQADGTTASALTAYVATGTEGLAIVDVTNFRRPTVRSQLHLAGDATDIAVDSNLKLAAVATGAAGVAIVDVSNPTAPQVVRTLGVSATRVEIVDSVVYVGSGRHLYAFDLVSGDLQRQLIEPDMGVVFALAHDGTRLYAVTGDGASSTRVLRIFETAGAALQEVGSLVLQPGDYGDGDRIFATKGILYIGAGSGVGSGSFTTVDVSSAATPSFIAHPVPGGLGGLPPVAGRALALDGSGRIVAVQDVVDLLSGAFVVRNAVDVLGAGNPASTNDLKVRFDVPQVPLDVKIAQGLGFVADGTGGLQIVNYAGFDLAGVAPTVSISSGLVDADPSTPGLQLSEGARITLGIDATDDRQISRVELLINGNPVAADVSYPWDISAILPTIAQNLGSTSLTIAVRATDTGGNVTVTAPVTATLVPQQTPFALIATSPSDSATVSALQHTVSFTFSQALDPRTVTTQNFTVTPLGGTQPLVPASMTLIDNGTKVILDFGSLAIGTGYTVDINAAAIRDVSGTVLGAADIATHFAVAAEEVWIGPQAGDWATPANWNIGLIPLPSDNVAMNLVSGQVATYTSPATTVSSLTVAGAGAFELRTSSSPSFVALATSGDVTNSGNISLQQSELTVGSALHNSGIVTVDGTGTNFVTLQFASAAGRIDGGGTIILNNGLPPFVTSGQLQTGNDRLAGVQVEGGVLTTTLENVDNTITGTGHIGVGFVSVDAFADRLKGDGFINDARGVIKVTGSEDMEINAATLVNHGLIEAIGADPQLGADLDFATHFVFAGTGLNSQLTNIGLDIDNRDGLILADGAGSSVNFAGAVVHGGTLQTKNGGDLFFEKWGLSAATKSKGVSNSPMLDGTTNAISIIGADASQLALVFSLDETFVQGSIQNHGAWHVFGIHETPASAALGYQDRTGALVLSRDTTLSGGGFIQLERSFDALSHNLDVGIAGSGLDPNANFVLTNVDNTIEGAGTIGYAPNLHLTFGAPANRLTIVNEAAGRIEANAFTSLGSDPFTARLDIVNVDLTNRGNIDSTGSGGMLITNSTILNQGTIRADGGDITVQGDIDDQNGQGRVVAANGSAVTISGALFGHGHNSVDAGGALEIGDFQNGDVTFTGANDKLILDQSIIAAGLIRDFVVSDRLDLRDIDFASAVFNYTGTDTSGTLTVSDGLGHIANLALAFSGVTGLGTNPNHFFLADDGNGGVFVTTDVVLGSNGGGGGTITNTTSLEIGPGFQPNIVIDQDTTLLGGGSVGLIGSGSILSSAAVRASGNPVTFENKDNEIFGTGTIGDSTLALYNSGGVIVASTGDALTIDASGTRNANLIQANGGGSLTVTNDIDDWFSKGSVAAVGGGTIKIGGLLHGLGSNFIGNDASGGTMEVGFWQDGSITFNGSNDHLILDNSAGAGHSGTIIDFGIGDTLELHDISFAGPPTLGYSGDATGGTLTVSDGTHTANLALLGNYMAAFGAPSDAHFTALADAQGGTVITTDVTITHP